LVCGGPNTNASLYSNYGYHNAYGHTMSHAFMGRIEPWVLDHPDWLMQKATNGFPWWLFLFPTWWAFRYRYFATMFTSRPGT
jgi:hypothetical protein